MNPDAHLWAVGFDTVEGAAHVRECVAHLAESSAMTLLDVAVAVRYADGATTVNGQALIAPAAGRPGSIMDFLMNLALAAPALSAGAVDPLLGVVGGVSPGAVGISDQFIAEVARLLKPGSSALFVLDRVGNMEAILSAIRGQGGTVLKTTVDLPGAELIQSTLSARTAN